MTRNNAVHFSAILKQENESRLLPLANNSYTFLGWERENDLIVGYPDKTE